MRGRRREAGGGPGPAARCSTGWCPASPDDQHPRDLSEGQRLALVLASCSPSRPPVLLLDEPTRGLDYAAKRVLAEILAGLADDGHAVLVATHDVEFVASVADDVVVLAEGEVVSAGPVRRVVAESPAFAPAGHQDPRCRRWLRVDEVAEAAADEPPMSRRARGVRRAQLRCRPARRCRARSRRSPG